MTDLFTTRGTLTVSIGEGFLSSFEVSTLKKGDIVRTIRLCGMPSMMHFNGVPLCPCEVVVLGGIFAVRVTQRPGRDLEVLPGLATRDDLVEILPFMVSLASVHMSLAELKTAGPGTIIGLGKPYTTDVDAELSVAGIPAATGKVVAFIGPSGAMGIQIDRVYGTTFKEKNIRSSGYLHEPGSLSEKWVPYNFTLPDKFTVNSMTKMDAIHALFFRNLRAGLPRLAELLADHSVHAALVDQLTFGEVAGFLPRDVKFGQFDAEIVPMRGGREAESREKGVREKGVVAFLEEEGTPHPVDPRIRREIEKLQPQIDMLRERSPIVFLYRDDAGMRSIFESSEGQEALLACLRGAWKNLVDLRIQPSTSAEAQSGAPAIHGQEMIMAIAFNGKDGPCGLCLVYPYRTLEPYMGLLE
jgi:flagellar motor switch/type III secretory pathway protein FliN